MILSKKDQLLLIEIYNNNFITKDRQTIFLDKFYESASKLKDLNLIRIENHDKKDKRKRRYRLTDDGKLFSIVLLKLKKSHSVLFF